MTLQRRFHLSERFALQANADMFNVFNHPNFGSPINYLNSPLFGQQTLNNFLGSGGQRGGLNLLYQIGGQRSVQLRSSFSSVPEQMLLALFTPRNCAASH